MTTTTMPPPTVDPTHRAPATIASTASYAKSAPVWIFRAGSWLPGVVLGSSARAALVQYRQLGNQASAVDTAFAPDLAARDDFDPYLDPRGAATARIVGKPCDNPGTGQ